MVKRHLFTSESVTEGHPDKMADQISDAILDAIYEHDPFGRVACETLVATGFVQVAGQITTSCYIDIPGIVRKTVKDIGYTRAKYGFDGDTCAVLVSIDEQSSDIAQGVNEALEVRQGKPDENGYDRIGAGDQGMMFGYACRETPELMPLPISLAHKLAKKLAEVRKEAEIHYLRPDGKTQVTVEYEDDIPIRVDTIVVVAQHKAGIHRDMIKEDIIKKVITPIIPERMLDNNTKILINPTGRFVIGGPMGDTGLTGRKIIVDTYGGSAPHGGGCFSGKDPTKVDRSGNYAVRYVAKNIVAAGLADKCLLQVSYAIGVAHPVSITVDTFGTGNISDERILDLIHSYFDLRPAAIIDEMNLRRPIYKQVAAYGHFGRYDLDLPWESTDKAELLREEVGLVPSGKEDEE